MNIRRKALDRMKEETKPEIGCNALYWSYGHRDPVALQILPGDEPGWKCDIDGEPCDPMNCRYGEEDYENTREED